MAVGPFIGSLLSVPAASRCQARTNKVHQCTLSVQYGEAVGIRCGRMSAWTPQSLH